MIIMGGVEIKSTETQGDNLAMFFYTIATVQIQQLTASPFLMSKKFRLQTTQLVQVLQNL